MPEATGSGVMLAPTFNIMNFKSKAIKIGNCHAKVIELSAGKYVARDRCIFWSLFAEGLIVALGWSADGVMQIKSVGLE